MWFPPHCSLAVGISIDAHMCSGQIQSPGSNLDGDPENVGSKYYDWYMIKFSIQSNNKYSINYFSSCYR